MLSGGAVGRSRNLDTKYIHNINFYLTHSLNFEKLLCYNSFFQIFKSKLIMTDWPDVVMDEIFLKVGQASHEELNNMRQVCKAWNERIKIKLRAKNPSLEWGRIIASRIKMNFGHMKPFSVAEVTRVARLAHHGFLGPLDELSLDDVNLSSVPADHLASLASCVTVNVNIRNVSGCDLSTILDSLHCKRLSISRQSLSSEETQALVRAMEAGVENTVLGSRDVTLDIEALAGYSGQGSLTWNWISS